MQGTYVKIGDMNVDSYSGMTRCPSCLIGKHVSEMKECSGFSDGSTGYLCTACRGLLAELGIKAI